MYSPAKKKKKKKKKTRVKLFARNRIFSRISTEITTAKIGFDNEFLGYGILIDGGIGREMGKGVRVRVKWGGIENRRDSGKGERLRREK